MITQNFDFLSDKECDTTIAYKAAIIGIRIRRFFEKINVMPEQDISIITIKFSLLRV